MGGRRLWSGFVLSVAAFSLAACSGGGDDDVTAAPSSSGAVDVPSEPTEAAPSPEPSDEPFYGPHPAPTLTGATLIDDEAGAIAFVEYFVALMDYAVTTGDLERWELYSDDDCQFCTNLSESIAPIFDAGYVHRTDPTLITGTPTVEEVTSDGVYLVSVELVIGRSFDQSEAGEIFNEAAGSNQHSGFLVERLDGGSWVVYEVGAIS